jgi:hypothetical protein
MTFTIPFDNRTAAVDCIKVDYFGYLAVSAEILDQEIVEKFALRELYFIIAPNNQITYPVYNDVYLAALIKSLVDICRDNLDTIPQQSNS